MTLETELQSFFQEIIMADRLNFEKLPANPVEVLSERIATKITDEIMQNKLSISEGINICNKLCGIIANNNLPTPTTTNNRILVDKKVEDPFDAEVEEKNELRG